MTFLPSETLKTAAHGLAYSQSRDWLPLALLLLALSSVFLFGGARGYFYKDGLQNYDSAKNLTIAENLHFEHRFLMFIRQQGLDANGKPDYRPYNRFPIGGFALIKLAILPFGDDLSAKIYAGRMLVLLLFSAAAVLAYLSLRRLTPSRWIALTATLLAFSSTYFLNYNDTISNEMMIDLFGVMLVFHGMTIFEQDGRFRQLLLKACAALLLGWHVYALLLPFIAFGLTRELIKARSSVPAPHLALRQLKHSALSLLRSRYLTLGAVALLFGVSLLSFNFTNEYFALNREVPFTELPSFNSMLHRTSIDPYSYFEGRSNLSWTTFLGRQFYRIGTMSLPYAFSPPYVLERMMTYDFVDPADSPQRLFIILGIAVSGASLISLLFVRRHKILLSTLALSGFCWGLPMYYTTAFPNHNFEAIFYIGVTLTLFSFVLLRLRGLWGERPIAAMSAAALLIFVVSALRMSQLNDANQTAELHQAAIADFEIIRNMTDEKVTAIGVMPRFHEEVGALIHYYLSGRTTIFQEGALSVIVPDFVVTGVRLDGLASLTPHNQTSFLYEWNDYRRHIDEITEQEDDLIIRSDFDVHLNGNNLLYVKDDCSEDDVAPWFFLALYPSDENDLTAERRLHGFDNLDFYFFSQDVQYYERCIAITSLPEYDIARIYTGQYIQRADGSFEHLWEGEFRPLEAVN